jgi:hypothetical protein
VYLAEGLLAYGEGLAVEFLRLAVLGLLEMNPSHCGGRFKFSFLERTDIETPPRHVRGRTVVEIQRHQRVILLKRMKRKMEM